MRNIQSDTVSYITHIFAQDSASLSGGAKTALVYSDITAYYVREGGTLTQLTMVTISTLGTWDTDVTSDKLGFKLLHDTNAPGGYELHLPNNILAIGSKSVTIFLTATGAVIAPVMIQLYDEPSIVGRINDAGASTTGAITTLTGYGNDYFNTNKSIIAFMSGNLKGTATPITGYTSLTGAMTWAALAAAPDNNSRIKVLGYGG